VLRFTPDAARWVEETPWHPSARSTKLDGGSIEVQLRVASEVEMRPWVLRWGSNVEVIAPASLREYVSATLRKAAAQYR
jgi:proteasome accessory factor B